MKSTGNGGINRRQAALATAAMALGQEPAKPIRIAFLGVIHSHGEGKLAVVRKNPSFELAGVYEPDPKLSAKLTAAGVKLLTRDEILKDRTIAAVAIESQVWDLAENARLALEAGKHVHIEKPPTADLRTFQQLQKLAGAGKLILQTGYMWRYNPGVQRIFDAVKQGWLGDIFLVRAMMNTQIATEVRPDWARFKGGDMFEQGSHLVEFMVRLMGKPANVTSVLRKHGKQYQDQLADNTAAIFEWPGALGVLSATALQANARVHRFMEVQGSKGTALLRPIEEPVLAIDLTEAAGPYSKGAQRVVLPPYRRYEGDFEEFASCIAKGKPLSVVTPEQDLAVHETLLRASQML